MDYYGKQIKRIQDVQQFVYDLVGLPMISEIGGKGSPEQFDETTKSYGHGMAGLIKKLIESGEFNSGELSEYKEVSKLLIGGFFRKAIKLMDKLTSGYREEYNGKTLEYYLEAEEQDMKKMSGD